MKDRLEFLRRRQSGIGGSDVAAILGISPWRTPLDVYLSKVDPIDEAAAAAAQSEPAYWGSKLEDVVAFEYGVRTESPLQRINRQLVAPAAPHLIANLDRVIVASGTRARVDSAGILRGAAGLLEAKTAGVYSAADWGRGDDADAIPLHYAAQGMAYMAVTGLSWCDFACLIGGQRFVVRRLERDEDTIAGIIQRVEQFWREHVEPRRPPPAMTAGDVTQLFPRDDGGMVDADAATIADIEELRRIRAEIKEMEALEAPIVERLKLAIGEHAGIAIGGTPAVTWKAAKDSQAIDWRAIVDEIKPAHEVIARHTSTKPGSRRFLLPATKA